VRELVRHHALELLAREARQGALRDADHAGAAQVAEGERVEPQRRHDEAVDARRAGGDAHLLDDVRQAVVIPVAAVKRLAVHGRE